MAEFATKGVAGTALGLGAGALGVELLRGGLNGLFGGYANSGENMPVSRYEAGKDARIAQLETEVKLRDANVYTDQKLNDLRNYVEHKFDRVDATLCQQAVYNATNTATIGCIQQQVAQLQGLTKVIVPKDSICPEPMPRYNSFVAPTQTTETGT